MWPFNRQTRRGREIADELSRYPALVDALRAKPEELTIPPPVRRDIHFILLQLDDRDLDEIHAAIGQATTIALGSNGLVEDYISSLILITFGAVIADPDAASNQAKTVSSYLSDLGPRMRMVYGQATALVGNIGDHGRFNFGSVIPNFGQCLERLLQLEFGTAQRI
jgi:hypothetical protein